MPGAILMLDITTSPLNFSVFENLLIYRPTSTIWNSLSLFILFRPIFPLLAPRFDGHNIKPIV
jgi:hypothetical protein